MKAENGISVQWKLFWTGKKKEKANKPITSTTKKPQYFLWDNISPEFNSSRGQTAVLWVPELADENES